MITKAFSCDRAKSPSRSWSCQEQRGVITPHWPQRSQDLARLTALGLTPGANGSAAGSSLTLLAVIAGGAFPGLQQGAGRDSGGRTGALAALLEGEGPVEDLGRVLGGGGEAGERGAEDDADEDT